MAINPDGSRNGCTNSAKVGSVISLFVHGLGNSRLGAPVDGIEAQAGTCPLGVESVTLSGLVYKVDIRLPAALFPCSAPANTTVVSDLFNLTLEYNDTPVGPLVIGSPTAPSAALSQRMPVWAAQ